MSRKKKPHCDASITLVIPSLTAMATIQFHCELEQGHGIASHMCTPNSANGAMLTWADESKEQPDAEKL